MRYACSWMIVVAMAALPFAGCRLPGREGPVPQSLADCRRLSQQGVAALERGRQEDAEALLAKAVAACPVDAEARRHYAESLWRRGARPEAIAQLEESGRLAGDDALLWTRLAEMYLATGQLELASKNAERAIDLDPRLPGAWAIRGGVMRAVGQPAEALTCYLRALGYAPKDRAILLESDDPPAFAVRRVQFDDNLLEQARAAHLDDPLWRNNWAAYLDMVGDPRAKARIDVVVLGGHYETGSCRFHDRFDIERLHRSKTQHGHLDTVLIGKLITRFYRVVNQGTECEYRRPVSLA